MGNPQYPGLPQQGKNPMALDPLPIPGPPPNIPPKTAEVQPPEVQPGSGWMGKTGKVAQIADKFLEGWMKGTQVAQQRKDQQAQAEVSGIKSVFDMARDDYQRFVNQPVPDQAKDPEGYSKWQKEKQTRVLALQHARDGYVSTMEKYVIPPPPEKAQGAKGKLKQFGHNLKEGMTAQNPQMFAKSVLDAYKQIPVDQLASPDPEVQAQQRANQLKLEAMEREKQVQEQREQMSKDAATAAQKGDYSTLAKLSTQMSMLYGDGKVITPDQLKAQEGRAKVDAAQSGILGAIFDKKSAGKELDPTEQRLYMASMGVPQEKSALDMYLEEVGPNKHFKSNYEAARQFMRDQDAFKNAYRPESQFDFIRNAGREILTAQLGRAPTKAELAQWAIDHEARFETQDEKTQAKFGGPLTPVAANDAYMDAVHSAAASNPEWEKFLDKPTYEPKKGFVPKFKPDPRGIWDRQFGSDDEEIKKEYQDFQDAIHQHLVDQGYSDNQIRQIHGESPVAGKGEGGGGDQPKQYNVSKGGKVVQQGRQMTPEQVDKAKKSGYSVSEIGGGK